MEPYQERIVQEKADLDLKIGRLGDFTTSHLFPKLPQAEQKRLMRQLKVMWEYSNILCERIEAF